MKRGAPAGLLGMLVLVAGVELVLAHQGRVHGDVDSRDWGECAAAAKRRAPTAEILCLGDSQVKTGVLAPVLADRTGLATYNLATFAGPAPATYFLLRRAFDAGARPKALVVDFKSFILGDDLWRTIDRWPSLLSPREVLELAWTARDASLGGALLLREGLASLRDRFLLRDRIRCALAGIQPEGPFSLLRHRRNLARNLGSIAMSRVAPVPAPGPDDRGMFPAHWRPHRVNVAYVDRVLDLAARHGVPVFWVLPPDFPGVNELRRRIGADERFEGFVRLHAGRHTNVVVVDARRGDYPEGVFSDPLHLDAAGAFAFSDDLAAVLGRTLREGAPTSRWVELPGYRPRVVDVAIEDMRTSHAALLHGDGAVRR